MKFVHLALIVVSLSALTLATAQPVAGRSGTLAYDRAVDRYLKAAAKELHAYHVQILAAAGKARGAVKQRCQEALADLHRCEVTLKRLKKSDHSSFDSIKAEYEQDRARLARIWSKVRRVPDGQAR